MDERAAEKRTHPSHLLIAAALGCSLATSGCAKDKVRASPAVESETRPLSADVSSRHGAACGPRGLPPDRHFVAEGLCARVVAYEQGPLRGLTFAPNGDLFAVTSDGEVRRYRDVDHDGVYSAGGPESVVWATTGGDNGHNCEIDGPWLYCGSKSGVKRWRVGPAIDRGGPGEEIITGVADSGRHPKHPVAIARGWLYVVSGSADNSMSPMPLDYDTHRSVVKRFALDKLGSGKPVAWSAGEIVTRGVRNVTAIAGDTRGRVVGIDNSMDDLVRGDDDIHQDNPGEAIVAIEPGTKYGYPYCFFAQRVVTAGLRVPPGTPLASEVKREAPAFKELAKTVKSTRDDAWCKANVGRPLGFIQAHSSALGMIFPRASGPFALPSAWRSGAFVALHGSWDRETSTGNKVVWIPFDAAGATPMPTPTKDATRFPYATVFGGGKYGAPRDGEWSWRVGDAGEDPVRPVSVAISPVDGALYVSSDNSAGPTSAHEGAIYRVALLGR